MKISPARQAAFDILLRIDEERAFSGVLLAEAERRLSDKDKALCHQITLGVLRRQIYLDQAIDTVSGKKKIDPAVRISLRIGLFQILFLDRVPSHSAVDESVKLVARARKSSARGFVNAILRRLIAEPVILSYSDEIERISIETSHPRWLIERWIAQFGPDTAERVAQANNQPSPVAFRIVRHAVTEPAFDGWKRSSFVPGCYLADSFTPELAMAVTRKDIYIQDEGSQLVANAVDIRSGGDFLDVCAAPGSKTSQIALRSDADLIVAGELHSHRVRFLRENLRSQGIDEALVLQYDAEASLPFADQSFDVVLVDAPCSGTGTIRHNPEIRYFLQASDLEELSAKQRRILANASKTVRSGGLLIYSTCSLEAEENEAVADAFLREHRDFRKMPPRIPAGFIRETGYARTAPYPDNMDGFFVAAFSRTGDS